MENASKALIMAGGTLIGILILTLAVYLFITFGQSSSEIRARIFDNQLTQYNVQYTIYLGRDDITIYEIISVANLANNNNKKYKDYSNFEENYKVIVNFPGYPNLQDEIENKSQELLNGFTGIDANQVSNENNRSYLTTTFRCTKIEYHDKTTGQVSKITFDKN